MLLSTIVVRGIFGSLAPAGQRFRCCRPPLLSPIKPEAARTNASDQLTKPPSICIYFDYEQPGSAVTPRSRTTSTSHSPTKTLDLSGNCFSNGYLFQTATRRLVSRRQDIYKDASMMPCIGFHKHYVLHICAVLYVGCGLI